MAGLYTGEVLMANNPAYTNLEVLAGNNAGDIVGGISTATGYRSFAKIGSQVFLADAGSEFKGLTERNPLTNAPTILGSYRPNSQNLFGAVFTIDNNGTLQQNVIGNEQNNLVEVESANDTHYLGSVAGSFDNAALYTISSGAVTVIPVGDHLTPRTDLAADGSFATGGKFITGNQTIISTPGFSPFGSSYYNGYVVGRSGFPGIQDGWLGAAYTFVPFGSSIWGRDVTNNGLVVGSNANGTAAMTFDLNTGVTDMVTLTSGAPMRNIITTSNDGKFLYGINNDGAIVRATAVPEPGTMAVLGAGVLATLYSRKKRPAALTP